MSNEIDVEVSETDMLEMLAEETLESFLNTTRELICMYADLHGYDSADVAAALVFGIDPDEIGEAEDRVTS